ncbi:MAG: UDP-glucose 4-epimerase GalE [Gammaproteobacteria bacterium]|nr:UDP-glucose 4-epimerase GalE [Gammaproteobacteria bacterium]
MIENSMISESKKVLVTGGAGYIGSHMVLKLLEAGHQPIVVDDLSKGSRSCLPAEIPLHVFNIADEEKLNALFKAEKIDVVMHFAAFTGVGESVENPDKYYKNNFSNTLTLLNAILKSNIKYFIFSSTASIFGEPNYVPMDEKHLKNPINPYGMSKLMCEQVLKDFDTAYGMKSVCFRYFNAAGADPLLRTGFRKNDVYNLIPIVLKVAAGEQAAITINGNNYATKDGTCVRDYIHVMDLCDAHLLGMNYLLNGGITCNYNLGNGLGYSVREVINAIEKVTEKKLHIIEGNRRAGDPAVLIADSNLIRTELGWKPQYSELETIVQHAWDWENLA